MGSQMIVKCAHCGDCLNRMMDDHAAIPDPGGATYLHAPECHDAYNAARLTDRIAQLTADLAAAKAEAGAYREALETIVKHQKLSGGGLSNLSTVRLIAESALATPADLLSRAAVLWPDAPGLPEEYVFRTPPDALGVLMGDPGPNLMFNIAGLKNASQWVAIGSFAAEAVVMRVVQQLGAWWVQQGNYRVFRISGDLFGCQSVEIVDHSPGGFVDLTPRIPPDTDLAAHLAALQAIVEQGEASRNPTPAP